MKKLLNFTLGYSKSRNVAPDNFFTANVPGNVQYDYALANNYPPLAYGLNCRDYKWMEDAFWTYKADLNFTLNKGEKATLCFLGIDYEYEILINGKLIIKDEGMFAPIYIDVTKYAGKPSILEVVIYPVPKCDDSNCRDQARKSFKPCVCYGWDYHPRVVSMGIWNDAYLEITSEICVESLQASYRLNDELSSVKIDVFAKINGSCNVDICLEYSGKTVVSKTVENASGDLNEALILNNPKLWNPVGYGEQNLYKLVVKTIVNGVVLHQKERSLGFRRSKLVMNEGAWVEPSTFPKGRSVAPATFEINGRRIFAKGTNWVNTDIFIGKTTEDEIRNLLTLIRDANMNIIRVHGGGPINKECFYDICDEYGIMVWQEFPLACNNYPDDDGLLAVIEKEATAIINRLKTHPCLVLWCGGNELFNNWSGMTDQSHVLRLLGSLCYKLDRFTPFNATAPLFGMSHGHYVNYFEESGREVITDFIESKNTAYTEFGSPSMASIDYLRAIMSEEDLNDCNASNEVWREHHAFDSWIDESWARKPEVEYYFGGYDGIEDLCNKTRFIQAIGYRSLFEEMRKQWPYCAMALNWCFNEPWPTAANNSLVSYPNIVKPAYYTVQQALRPQLVSIRANRNLWWTEETYRAEVWVLNDSLSCVDDGEVSVYYAFDDGEYIKWGTLNYSGVCAQTNKMLGEISFKIPNSVTKNIKILLKASNEKLNSEYVHPVRSMVSKEDKHRLNF